MADKLKSFIDSSNQEKTLQIMHIISPSPKFTAVKVIESLKHQDISTSGFKQDDSFTVTSLSRLQKRNFEIVCIKTKFLDEQTPQQLLVIVNDNDIPFQVVEFDTSGGNISFSIKVKVNF